MKHIRDMNVHFESRFENDPFLQNPLMKSRIPKTKRNKNKKKLVCTQLCQILL